MVEGQQQLVSGAHSDGANYFARGAGDCPSLQRTRPPLRPAAPLTEAIEAAVIPRLVMARSQVSPASGAPEGDGLGSTPEIEAFTDILIGIDPDGATAYAFGLFARGASAETLFLALLAPAARHLGDLWLTDRCSFAHVTLGVWRLQQLLRDLTPAFQQTAGRVDVNRNILLVNLPEEQHTFGVTMLAEFFRRARWNVACANPLIASGDAADLVRTESFNVVGLSLSSDVRLDELARLIRAIRHSSCNRTVGIMVGGAVFLEHPEFVARVGADISAVDGKQAPLQAETLAACTASVTC